MKDHSQRLAARPTGNTHDHDGYRLCVLNQRIEAPSPRRENLDWTHSVPFDSVPVGIIIQNDFKTYSHDGSLGSPVVGGRVAHLPRPSRSTRSAQATGNMMRPGSPAPSTGCPTPRALRLPPGERRLRPVDSGRLKRSSPSATVGLSLAALGSLGLVVAAAYIPVYTQTINGLSLVFVRQTAIEHYGVIALVPVSLPLVPVMTLWTLLLFRRPRSSPVEQYPVR